MECFGKKYSANGWVPYDNSKHEFLGLIWLMDAKYQLWSSI